VYFQVISKENSEAIEFAKAELIQVNAGSKTVVLNNIKHVNNGRSSFEFTPLYNGEGSSSFVIYYLKIVKTAGEASSKEFELPKVNKNQMLSVTFPSDDSLFNLKAGYQLSMNVHSTDLVKTAGADTQMTV